MSAGPALLLHCSSVVRIVGRNDGPLALRFAILALVPKAPRTLTFSLLNPDEDNQCTLRQLLFMRGPK